MYHVLLVGIDQYPSTYRSLFGCVNDIDALERLLLDAPGVDVPASQIRITRLAAPRPDRPSTSSLLAKTQAPTRANLVAALKALAGPEIKPEDRVLIYYSGHGQQERWPGSTVWHEALVPNDGQNVEYLWDVELNALIQAISARTTDLTVLLDCCHSAGATRDLVGVHPLGAERRLGGQPGPVAAPDLSALGVPGAGAPAGDRPGHLLQGLDPNYLAVVACQPQEKACEGHTPEEELAQGVLTYSLLAALAAVPDAGQRAKLRWADVWPDLLDRVAARSAQLNRQPQHPWLIGRSERYVFGGKWHEQDAGYSVTRLPDGRYRIGAGTLMGLTVAAEVAVFGETPARFPPLDSSSEPPTGRLRVVAAERAECTAEAIGTPFNLPKGPRGRLVKPGMAERLRVALKSADPTKGGIDPTKGGMDPTLVAELAQSPLLELVPAGTVDAEAEVTAQADGSWIVGNDTEALLARVPPKATRALRRALEHCYRIQAARRLHGRCNDPELSGSLDVHVLDCGDGSALKAMPEPERSDPRLPEAALDSEGIYSLPAGTTVCYRLTNRSRYTLYVTVLDCAADGVVEYLGHATLRARDESLTPPEASEVLWLRGEVGQGFKVWPGMLPEPGPGAAPRPFVTDRILVIGTTRENADLHYLEVDKAVQEVVDAVRNKGDAGVRHVKDTDTTAAPPELWTARDVPLRIRG